MLAHGSLGTVKEKSPRTALTIHSPRPFLLLVAGPTQALQNHPDQPKLSEPTHTVTIEVWGMVLRAHGGGRERTRELEDSARNLSSLLGHKV